MTSPRLLHPQTHFKLSPLYSIKDFTLSGLSSWCCILQMWNTVSTWVLRLVTKRGELSSEYGASCVVVYGQLVLLQTRTESTRTFSLVNLYFFVTRTLVNSYFSLVTSYFFFGQLVLFEKKLLTICFVTL